MNLKCAVYVRKSNAQNDVAEDEKSVARQLDRAQRFAESQGWTVDPGAIYQDDAIGGAEFESRDGLMRLLAALKPAPPFGVLIVMSKDRLGREQFESAYNLKRLAQAGVRVFEYLSGKECLLSTPTEKFMVQVESFAAEQERYQASQRTRDALQRKAERGHVTGGRVFGYDNVTVTDAAGKRSHVIRRINPAEADAVRHLCVLYAEGHGLRAVALQLNAENTPAPKPKRATLPTGWTPSSVREILHRELYRGVVVWGRTRKRDAWGQKRQSAREASAWVRREAPELVIVAPALAVVVDTRLRAVASAFPRGAHGALTGGAVQSPGYASRYVLTGVARCSVCGGPIGTINRTHGTGAKRWPARFYGCSTRDRRGPAICGNGTLVRHAVLDAAVLDAVRARLDDGLVRDAIDRALALRRERQGAARERRPAVERELHAVEQRIGHLVDAIAAGGPVEELLDRLRVERDRKTALMEEQRTLKAGAATVDQGGKSLVARLTARAAELRGLLGVHVARTRQLLSAMLAGPVVMVPVVENGRRGYRFSGRLRLGGLLAGDSLETRHAVVAPTGFEPVFQP